ncbi:hypothetical protein DHEL01_v200354 [Diaporthe helianthi]|uniref:Uncharacterized protein n=1 Tax=Diaporthe helianthi TaxID=158607 RepID=A0A2P5IFJ5_DIAHE|nr:hypothetical protein DHEL01_v200354 [Diaporthe helianthi]
MAKKGGGAGENSKKAAGQSRKAEAAANKKAAEDSKKAAVEDAEWSKGSKKANAKKEEEAAKKAEAARKKAEREALLAEEEKNTPGRSAPKNAKAAQKKTRLGGLDAALGGVDWGDGKLATLNASGLDNALDALDISLSDDRVKIDRHPERRVNKVFTAWKKQQMEQLTEEGYFKIKGHSRSKKEEQLWEEFQDSPENPMNQVHGRFDTTREEMAEIRAQEKANIENLLAEK